MLLWAVILPTLHILIFTALGRTWGFPGGSDSKESACSAGDPGSILWWGRYLGERNDYPLQYSFLENPMNRSGWQTTVHRVTKSWTQLRDSHTHTHTQAELTEHFVRRSFKSCMNSTRVPESRDKVKSTKSSESFGGELCWCYSHALRETNSLRRTMQIVECCLLHRRAQGRVSS